MAEVMLFHFRDRRTFLNQTNPLIKILLTLLFSYTLVHGNLATVLVIFAMLAISSAIIRLPIGSFRRELRFFLLMGTIIAVSQLLSTHNTLTTLTAVIRFLDIVLMGMIFADTTAPDDLSRSLGALLSHLPWVHGGRIAATLELTLTTIPLLFDASAQIHEARLARLENPWHHPIRRILSYASAVFTLLLERAEDLGMALDARSFDVDAKRETPPLRAHDAVVAACAATVLVPLLFLG